MDRLLGALADMAAEASGECADPQAKNDVEEPFDSAGAFHDRTSLLKALIAVEVLGAPPALRPRELRSDVW